MSSGPFLFCPYCQSELAARQIPDGEGPLRRVCSSCGFIEWGSSKPTAGGVIVDDQNRALLVRRAIAPSLGLWDVPGGFLEAGETPEAGAIRELHEETGLHVELVALLGVFTDTYGTPRASDGWVIHTLNCHYLCRIVGGTLAPADDASEAEWFAAHDLPTDLAFPNTRDALEAWQKRLHTLDFVSIYE